MVTQLLTPHPDPRYPGMLRVGSRRGAGSLMECVSCGWRGWTCFGHAHAHRCTWKRALYARQNGNGGPKAPEESGHGSTPKGGAPQRDEQESTTHG